GVPRKITRTTGALAPFSRFDELADLAPDQVALECGDMGDIEPAKQMIGFVLKSSGEQIFTGLLECLALDGSRANSDALAAGDVLSKAWNAQAAFLALLLAFHMDNFGIDQHDLLSGIFSHRAVDYSDAAGKADLRRGQPDALGCIHRLEHFLDEVVQFGCIELGYR